MTKQHTFAITN